MYATWDREETWEFLEDVIAVYQAQCKRYLVLLWDHGPWHVAAGLRWKGADHNRHAKRAGSIHVLLFFLPIRSSDG